MIENLFAIMKDFYRPVLEIIILWFVLYHVIIFTRGTGGIYALRGLLLLVAFLFITKLFGLHTLNWALTQILSISVVGFLIIFQPELRKGLVKLGLDSLVVKTSKMQSIRIIEKIADAAFKLSKEKQGGLIVLEREADLSSYAENGVILESMVSQEILQSIFIPAGPLHDGGVLIRGERIVAAACLFPLSSDVTLSKTMGTRHRAAMGLSEETDAIVIVVSEKTGRVSVVIHGHMQTVSDTESLVEILKKRLGIQIRKGILG
ncbi:TIGR00159 family protein [bacterium Unc6]|nr:TIGR00159 family protein [bacterium Unc6]